MAGETRTLEFKVELPEESVKWVKLDGKVIVVVEVFPGNDTPYYINSLGKANGTFIRLNATTRNADAANLDELELRKKRKYYDELPIAMSLA